MHTFELTIQRKLGNHWPVVVEYTLQGDPLPKRAEGKFALDLTVLNGALPESYGEILGRALFRDEVRQALVAAQPHNNALLHICLFVEADDLRTLRWERLQAPARGGWSPLAQEQLWPFSLYLPTTIDRQFSPFGRRDLRALVVVSSPSDLTQFRLQPFDAAKAVDAFRKAARDPNIPFDLLGPVEGALGPATLNALCSQITSAPYTILHIIGHGTYKEETQEPALYLSNVDNTTAYIPATELVSRLGKLRGARGLPHLAFLCCCELASPEAEGALGGLAQRLVRDLGMPAVIAMTDRVSVATATDLSESFYRLLWTHGEVDRALSESYAGLANRRDVAVPVPVLFSRLGGRPLFSDTLDRELTSSEVIFGLDKLNGLVEERSPVLLSGFKESDAIVRGTLHLSLEALSTEVQRKREKALAAVNELCGEVVELSFKALAVGQKPLGYDPRCPFLGLYQFTEVEREFFFGREPLIERLRKRLIDKQPTDPSFLAVLGPSGSGKSSIVLAGLLPQLCPGQNCSGSAVMTPGNDPTARLEHTLASADGQPVVVVVDQFEEVFTLCTKAEAQTKFFDRLINLAQKVKVIVTMRADFWGDCAAYPPLRELMQAHQELVPAMDEVELRRAMESQAAKVGLRFEANLANEILDDVRGEPGAMPLLQHALRELWKRRHGRWLKANEYADEDKLGGVRRAISRTADILYEAATQTEQAVIRFVFERLARIDTETPEPEKRRDTRRRESLEGLTPDGGDSILTRQVVTRLATAKLVVTSRAAETGRVEVEVAHEALIRYWDRLRSWLNEVRDTERLVSRIRDAAAAYYGSKADRNYLTFRGGVLAEAERLTSDKPRRLTREEVKFVEACRSYENEQAAAWTQLRNRIIIGLVVGLMITIGLLFLSRWEWLQSEKERKKQQALRIAAQSRALREDHPQLSSLLAIEAAGLEPDEPDVIRSLRDASEYCAGFPLEGPDGPIKSIKSLAICPNKQWLVTGGGKNDGRVILWELLRDGSPPKLLSELHKFQDLEVRNVAFSPNGEWLAVGGDSFLIWDLRKGMPSNTNGQQLGSRGRKINLIRFPSERQVVTADGKLGGDDILRVYSLAHDPPVGEGQELGGLTGLGIVKTVATSPGGRWLLAGGSKGVVSRWDLSRPAEVF
jgi:CHAT domain/WD domain, G-beta repeat